MLTTEMETSAIEKTFEEFTQRKDIAILLINQHVLSITHQFADEHRSPRRYGTGLTITLLRSPQFLKSRARTIPMVILSFSSLTTDPEKDSVLKRLSRLLGND